MLPLWRSLNLSLGYSSPKKPRRFIVAQSDCMKGEQSGGGGGNNNNNSSNSKIVLFHPLDFARKGSRSMYFAYLYGSQFACSLVGARRVGSPVQRRRRRRRRQCIARRNALHGPVQLEVRCTVSELSKAKVAR